MTEMQRPDGSGLSEGLGAAVPKRDDFALWGNLVIAHVWGAAFWVSPGWLPALAWAFSMLIAGGIAYERKLRRRIAMSA